jgi:hypothetical protein
MNMPKGGTGLRLLKKTILALGLALVLTLLALAIPAGVREEAQKELSAAVSKLTKIFSQEKSGGIIEESAEIAKLPNVPLRSKSRLCTLRQAMAQDGSGELRNLAERFTKETEKNEIDLKGQTKRASSAIYCRS